MIGGEREASQPEPSPDVAPQPEDVHQVLDRLRSRIEEVAAWAEQASLHSAPAGPAAPTDATTPAESQQLQPVQETRPIDESPEPIAASEGYRSGVPAEDGALGFLRSLARTGVVAGGVFSSGSDIIDLTDSGSGAQVPESGLVALLNLVPSETVLEVRTTSTELRAARLGGDAFAVEVVPGGEREVDDWLASLIPAKED